jgi:hypothetical protein
MKLTPTRSVSFTLEKGGKRYGELITSKSNTKIWSDFDLELMTDKPIDWNWSKRDVVVELGPQLKDLAQQVSFGSPAIPEGRHVSDIAYHFIPEVFGDGKLVGCSGMKVLSGYFIRKIWITNPACIITSSHSSVTWKPKTIPNKLVSKLNSYRACLLKVTDLRKYSEAASTAQKSLAEIRRKRESLASELATFKHDMEIKRKVIMEQMKAKNLLILNKQNTQIQKNKAQMDMVTKYIQNPSSNAPVNMKPAESQKLAKFKGKHSKHLPFSLQGGVHFDTDTKGHRVLWCERCKKALTACNCKRCEDCGNLIGEKAKCCKSCKLFDHLDKHAGKFNTEAAYREWASNNDLSLQFKTYRGPQGKPKGTPVSFGFACTCGCNNIVSLANGIPDAVTCKQCGFGKALNI